MKYVNGLNEAGKKRFLDWVAENCRSAALDDGELLAPEAWLADFDRQIGMESSRRSYEMDSFESADGNPQLFYFDDDDLDFESVDDDD